MNSLFNGLLNGGCPVAVEVLELFLRMLRDSNDGQDYHRFFSVDTNRCVISFSEPFMDWNERQRFAELVSPILKSLGYLEFRLLTKSVKDWPPWKRGCAFELQIGNPQQWQRPAPKPTEPLFEVLWKYADSMGSNFAQRRSSAICNRPLEWAAIPVALPGVWLALTRLPGRKYPTLSGAFRGHVEQEVKLIAANFPDSRFSLARLAETDGVVWILFDYTGRQA